MVYILGADNHTEHCIPLLMKRNTALKLLARASRQSLQQMVEMQQAQSTGLTLPKKIRCAFPIRQEFDLTNDIVNINQPQVGTGDIVVTNYHVVWTPIGLKVSLEKDPALNPLVQEGYVWRFLLSEWDLVPMP